MKPFEVTFPGRVLFGRGRLIESGKSARQYGRRALVVTGRSPERAARLLELLQAEGLNSELFAVAGEPTTIAVEHGAARAREFGAEVVIGIGGGSALDAAKAVAALATNPGTLLDYLEVIGEGKPLVSVPLPVLAIPTTAGTGAEATRNSVLDSPAHQVKVSLRSPWLLPRLAIVDPDLTRGIPPEIVASTGLDALTQLLEAFVCSWANPVTDSLCRDGIARAANALPRVYALTSPDRRPEGLDESRDDDPGQDMALASLFSGIALANAGLGAVHGFAGPVGGMFDAPHGAICAALLPQTMQANLAALRRRAPNSPALGRYAEAARLLTGRVDATPDDGVDAVRRLCARLRVRGLGHFGVSRAAVPTVVAAARRASSMKANPIELTEDELVELLESSL